MRSAKNLIPLLVAWFFATIAQIKTDNSDQTAATTTTTNTSASKSQLWLDKQLNVLVDVRSLNETEQQIIEASLQQLEHKTCIRVNRLQSDRVNPFDTSGRQLSDKEKNFIYIFKSHIGFYNRPPTIGLSTFGCSQKGRQSLVLTDSAFRWPEIVLKYHLLRSLGVPGLQKPNEAQLLQIDSQQLPLSQKINALLNGTSGQTLASAESDDISSPSFAYATGPIVEESSPSATTYLSDNDLAAVKQLYDCPDYQSRLSVRPLSAAEQPTKQSNATISAAPVENTINQNKTDPIDSKLTAKKLKNAEESLRQIISSVAQERGARIDDRLVENAAKSIVHYLLAELEGEPMSPDVNPAIGQDGQQIESLIDSFKDKKCTSPDLCPNLDRQQQQQRRNHQERSTTDKDIQEEQRPMLLKLDPYHANDPQLRQANQMKLSQLNTSSDSMVPQTYRLLNNNQMLPMDQYGNQQPQPQSQSQSQSKGKSEMMISFEQMSDKKNPIDALASSQVLKLCSCTCQTMTPSGPSTSPPTLAPTVRPPTELPTDRPTHPTFPTFPTFPTYPTPQTNPMTDEYPQTPPPVTMMPPWTVTDYPLTPSWPSIDPSLTDDPFPPNTEPWLPPWTLPPQQNTTTKPPPSTKPTTKQPTTNGQEPPTSYPDTFTYAPTTPTKPTTFKPPTPTQRPTTTATTTGDESQTLPPANNNNSLSWSSACDQVQWVKPNKTIYSSAKIVWDVDRANQNYFLCNAQVDGGELVPGKTHGLSCKVSSEGKAYEMHQFQVLIKPESVNLAWVQKDSKSFGTKNMPVIGGHAKPVVVSPPANNNNLPASGDPYVVSRCLVRDENNDVITLIGYINRQNVGWFPFDDIQIECSQYDVLACVN